MSSKSHHTRRVLLAVLALSGLLGTAIGLALPPPASGSQVVPSGMTPYAFLPVMMQPEDTPTPTPTPTPIPTPTSSPPPPSPEFAIYDKYGTLQDWEWLVSVFGPVTLGRGTGAAKVVVLREAGPHIALIVRVENIYGQPLVGQEVAFYWPDAPLMPEDKQACGLDRGLIVPTNWDGKAEFPMYGGSMYYPDRGEAGPHVVWIVREGSDCLRGLGWIAGTEHYHLDSVWRLP